MSHIRHDMTHSRIHEFSVAATLTKKGRGVRLSDDDGK